MDVQSSSDQPAEICAELLVSQASVHGLTSMATPAATLPPTLAPRLSGRVLIVEPDVALSKFLSRGLAAECFSVSAVHNGEDALEEVFASACDLVVLELDLPGFDGLAMLRQVREVQPALPMIVLTARSRTEDLVGALESGADDFVMKPFSLIELVARMRSLLRRTPGTRGRIEKNLGRKVENRPGRLTVNREEYRVERNGRPIELTPREFAILEHLVLHAGRPVSRAALLEEVWKTPSNPGSNIVDVYMKYLRDKVDLPGEEKLIRTIRGVGYLLAAG